VWNFAGNNVFFEYIFILKDIFSTLCNETSIPLNSAFQIIHVRPMATSAERGETVEEEERGSTYQDAATERSAAAHVSRLE
jgi:hypothetical protein